MRITNSQLTAKNKQLTAQLEAQGNPGRVALKAKMADMAKSIESLTKANEGLKLEIENKVLVIDELKAELKEAVAA
jgi:hypothetical protein